MGKRIFEYKISIKYYYYQKNNLQILSILLLLIHTNLTPATTVFVFLGTLVLVIKI